MEGRTNDTNSSIALNAARSWDASTVNSTSAHTYLSSDCIRTSGNRKEREDSARTLLNVPFEHLVHAPPLPALEYVPGAHASGAEVTEEEHLDPAGHVVHVSVAPFEYVPFPQVSWAVAPMGAFARWPGATVVQPVTYFVFCSAIGEISQSTDRNRITLAVLTARECSIWTEGTLRRAGFRVRPCSA